MSHILVLEDDRAAREAIVDYLSEFGWDVQPVASAGEAMHLAEQTRPDLAICDWQLGGKGSGVDVARQLQRRFGTHIILVSAQPQVALKKSSSDFEVARYFTKPLSLTKLLETVQSAGI
ncbi:MAG: response regulator [Lysobacterales bacterium]